MPYDVLLLELHTQGVMLPNARCSKLSHVRRCEVHRIPMSIDERPSSMTDEDLRLQEDLRFHEHQNKKYNYYHILLKVK